MIQVGEICIRGPTVFAGYDNAPDMNLEARLFQLTFLSSRSTATAVHRSMEIKPTVEVKKRRNSSLLRLFDAF